jgi:preprotein translocase subunit SecA
MSFLSKLLGDPNEKEVKRLRPTVERINALEPEYEQLTNAELRAKTDAFRSLLAEHADDLDAQQRILDDILPEAFAMVREAAKRTIGQRHYDVQLIGGINLHQGKISEMKTGEGKTLVATLPTYLNALTGRGVHVVTVNDYLARRDAQWMGRIHDLLGLRVGVLQHETAYAFSAERVSEQLNMEHLQPMPRRDVYRGDVVYGTNHEFGFDYLRDNLAVHLDYCVQRELYYAIVDEVDNILIDEARTPLIISGPAQDDVSIYATFARIVPMLEPEADFSVDLKTRSVTLTESGVSKVERALGISNIYDPQNYRLTRYMEAALKANIIYQRDKDYVVKDGEVIIVDDFTGRLMPGRRWSDGLHQAVEAKERVKVQQESLTYATITLQNYFRLYKKLAGMTGTASTEAEEFHKIYKLDVLSIPTHRPMVRVDGADLVYRQERAKYDGVVEEVIARHATGQPVLVGTVAIEKSEYLSQLLTRKGVPHNVLNAKQHEREAQIVAEAGRKGAVTIATNMAGRGTDIILGGVPDDRDPDEWQREHDEVVALGGLHIIGTERHESRRIDNQLRGRAGRQGDPGSSRFYVSFEDELMRRFAPEWLPGMMQKLGMDDDTPLEHSWVTKAIQTAQVKVEGHNFDIRKNVVEYDDVMNKHREVIYAERRKILEGADLRSNILDMVDEEISSLVAAHAPERAGDAWDPQPLWADVNAIVPLPDDLTPEAFLEMGQEDLTARLLAHAHAEYERREQEMGEPVVRELERLILLKTIDSLWVEHLTAMDEMRQGIGLQAYAQIDPLVAYKREAFDMFNQLLGNIRNGVTRAIYHVQLAPAAPPPRPTVPPARMRVNVTDDDAAGGAAAALAAAAARANGGAAATRKVGRNDPCPCGSGKKYKRCHGTGVVVA